MIDIMGWGICADIMSIGMV